MLKGGDLLNTDRVQKHIKIRGTVIAQRNRLDLTSWRPGFESQAHNYFFIYSQICAIFVLALTFALIPLINKIFVSKKDGYNQPRHNNHTTNKLKICSVENGL